MLIKNVYEYYNCHKEEIAGIRKYITPDGKRLPSVTTILSRTKDMSFLDEWKNSIGIEKAEKIRDEAAIIGTAMHTNLENYITGKDISGSYMSKVLSQLIIKNGLCNVSEIWGNEVPLYTKDLYAGTTDAIGIFNGKPAIIDFKNSLRNKEKSHIGDYFLQLSAYAISHNEMYNTNINTGVIMIATREGKYQEFIIEGNDFLKYQCEWLERVGNYYDQYGYE